ncbi:hypothetical protein [Demequina sp. NBRC 110053]|uniref:hypothetical protein n=1 Tax=Demequina sp. NBRC 110053 TaxID=1570342 RepID=UPI001185D56D|nr:hypothetical protein [Demequina sp. NBRC 110053]
MTTEDAGGGMLEPSPHVRRAEALERKRRAESRQAAQMVRQFADAASAAGITPVRFTAQPYGGGSRLRTNVEGWYLKRDRTVGVGTDGQFYVLSVAPSLMARFTGAQLDPADPPLELGKGGRDGESMPMEEALRKRLEGGNAWAT